MANINKYFINYSIATIAMIHATSCEGDGSATLAPCTLETGLATHLNGVTVPTCATPECVMDAVAVGGPFVYREDLEGIDSLVAVAFVRSEAGGPIYRLYFDSDLSGGSQIGSIVSQLECSTLNLAAGCASSGQTSNCLWCPPKDDTAVRVCNGPPGGS